MMKYSLILTALVVLSCTAKEKEKKEPVMIQKTDPVSAAPKPSLATVELDSKKDLVCGMPVRTGVSDTAHFKGKIYGFCAIECKQEFVSNPSLYIADQSKSSKQSN
ncbi:MAG: hypothetical protein IPP31_05555 [Chitinophagaceae bacterium]|nr:hypothetical protein [Chitinophagaceae bacterium]